ncbi:uncharacterized protein [Symphalangus syndactylus]|uniref:uncharacterized protein isoform X1 n=1 Tax=Symphalangus syndactylus TaxID=9590 RepID=UPI002442F452|nr:uncharacterized protein LOC129485002 isoform X1 [Symphalangus syndactylus]
MEAGRNWGGGAGQGGLRPSPLKPARPRASLRSLARLAGEAPRTGGVAALNRNDLVWSGLAPSLLPRPLLSLSFSDGLVFAAVPDQENPSWGQLSLGTTTEVGPGPKDKCRLKQATVVRLQYAGRTSSRSTLLPLGGRLTPAWQCDCWKGLLAAAVSVMGQQSHSCMGF